MTLIVFVGSEYRWRNCSESTQLYGPCQGADMLLHFLWSSVLWQVPSWNWSYCGYLSSRDQVATANFHLLGLAATKSLLSGDKLSPSWATGVLCLLGASYYRAPPFPYPSYCYTLPLRPEHLSPIEMEAWHSYAMLPPKSRLIWCHVSQVNRALLACVTPLPSKKSHNTLSSWNWIRFLDSELLRILPGE